MTSINQQVQTALLLLACALFTASLPAQESVPGAIDGIVAVSAFPVITDSNGDTRRLPVVGCEVHLVEAEEQTTELVYPCGSWFQPPVARYLFWLEQGSTVSFQSVLSYAGETFTGTGLLLPKTMYPAGHVQLKKGVVIPPDGTFRLISLERVDDLRPFDRRIAGANAARAVRIPSGRVMGGIFDRYGRALALSEPRVVRAGATAIIDPATPAKQNGAVLAVLSRTTYGLFVPCEVELAGVQPRVDFQTKERVVLAWYDLAPALMRLNIACKDAAPYVRSLDVKRGEILTLRATIPKPIPPVPIPR